SYTFNSLVTLPADAVWVVLPKSMSFSGAGFPSSPQDPTVQTFMMRNVAPGKAFAFTVSGTGAFPREDQNAQSDNGQAGAPQSGPGGGIGEPINTPDPLSKYKWWILGGLALLLATVAAFLLRRPPTASVSAPAGTAPAAIPGSYSASATPAAKSSALLNALKEELFALESEKIAGTLSTAEYAEQKAAFETVLKRALKRQ
ncbi:MAG: carboxypeptidase regulatory-like domain-containing protein, partial [Terracidiphilus sp.]